MSQDPFATIPPAPGPSPASRPQPWGLAGSIIWGLAGVGVWFVAQFAVILAYVMTRDQSAEALDMQALARDGFLLALVTIIAGPAWVAVSMIAARWRGWHARDYLALVAPSRSQFAFGFACMAGLLIAFEVITIALGRDVVPPFMREAYISSRGSGSLVLFVLAVVVVGPVAEEVAFRGFLFRGLTASFLGVGGTLVVTSIAWALMHVQYDWFTIAQIFLIGILLGWLRWASGSLVLTIVLHMLANLVATIEAAVKVEWFS
jgi:uncharacterized protein